MKCLLHFLISAYILRCTYSERLRQIRLRGFQSMTGVGWAGGGACLPAALMAVRHVNERPGLLDGYNVTYSWADSKVTFTWSDSKITYSWADSKVLTYTWAYS